jgi:DHA1 family bicyclomycin/chloramphenicol resistance-like MFS transporter
MAARKGTVAIVLTAMVALGALSTDMYLPTLPDMTRALEATIPEVQLTLSLFMFVFAVSQLVYGPLSDRFGRRPVVLVGLSMYVVGSIACALAPSIEALMVARCLQAFGACSSPVLARAIVRDRYEADRAAQVLAYTASAMALVPALAPVIGGWIAVVADWRAIFWTISGLAVLLLLAVTITLPETNAHRGKTDLKPMGLLRNYGSFLVDRHFQRYMALNGLMFSGLFAFISGSSFVLIDVVGLSPSAFGWCFAMVVTGYIVGAQITGRFASKVGFQRVIGWGLRTAAVSGGLTLLFAVMGSVTFLTITVPSTIFALACGLILPNGVAGAISPYPTRAGAASALLGCVQGGSGAMAGVVVGAFMASNALSMTLVIGACGLLVGPGWYLLGSKKPVEEAS